MGNTHQHSWRRPDRVYFKVFKSKCRGLRSRKLICICVTEVEATNALWSSFARLSSKATESGYVELLPVETGTEKALPGGLVLGWIAREST